MFKLSFNNQADNQVDESTDSNDSLGNQMNLSRDRELASPIRQDLTITLALMKAEEPLVESFQV